MRTQSGTKRRIGKVLKKYCFWEWLKQLKPQNRSKITPYNMRRPQRRLVSFIGIGSASAAPLLYSYIKSHPGVCTAADTQFFGSTEAFKQGIDWYESFFAKRGASMVCRELAQYFSYYAPIDLLVVTAGDVRNDALRVVKETYEHIGVDSSFIPPPLVHLVPVEDDPKHKPGIIKLSFRFLKKHIKDFFTTLANRL